jgi:hypothetical protein
MLRFAVFALSSRHLNRHNQHDRDTEALEYHNKCLNLLIPTLSDPERQITEEIHAAVAILRQYEEMDCICSAFNIVLFSQLLTLWQRTITGST